MNNLSHKMWLFSSVFLAALMAWGSEPGCALQDPDSERTEILTKAWAIKSRLDPGLEEQDRSWIAREADRICQGKVTQEEILQEIKKHEQERGRKPMSMLFHVGLRALPLLTKKISRQDESIRQIEGEIHKLTEQVQSPDKADSENRKRLKELNQSRQEKMVAFQNLVHKKQNLIIMISDIMKKAGQKEEDIIKNLK